MDIHKYDKMDRDFDENGSERCWRLRVSWMRMYELKMNGIKQSIMEISHWMNGVSRRHVSMITNTLLQTMIVKFLRFCANQGKLTISFTTTIWLVLWSVDKKSEERLQTLLSILSWQISENLSKHYIAAAYSLFSHFTFLLSHCANPPYCSTMRTAQNGVWSKCRCLCERWNFCCRWRDYPWGCRRIKNINCFVRWERQGTTLANLITTRYHIL